MNPYQSALELTAPEGTAAQKKIRAALLELLEDKEPEKITVRELCARAQTGRSTFYLYYGNTEEVLAETVNLPVQDLVHLDCSQNTTNPEFVSRVWVCLSSRERLIRALVLGQKRVEFLRQLDLGLKYLLWERLFRVCRETYPEAELVVGMISASFLRASFYVMEHTEYLADDGGAGNTQDGEDGTTQDREAGGTQEQDGAAGSTQKQDGAAGSAVEQMAKDTLVGMLDMAESRISRSTRRCRVLKTGAPKK